MINENGEFYSQEEFERIFNLKTNFLQFQGIKQAIKAYIKSFNITRFTKKLHYPIIPSNLVPFMKSRKGGKEFYMILNKNEDKPTSQQLGRICMMLPFNYL